MGDGDQVADRSARGVWVRVRRWSRGRATAALTGGVLALCLGLTACDGGTGAEPGPTLRSTSNSSPAAEPVPLTFGVYGPPDEQAAFQRVVNAYNSSQSESRVQLRTWPSHDAMAADLRGSTGPGQDLPDVFMVSRADLSWLQQQHLTQPVDNLLDERGVDFGDGYARDSLEAFSADNRLQCMPYAISPMVIYYNKDLVDFARMRAKGLEAPDPAGENPRWSFDQFVAAAKFATRPRAGTRGVYISPSLEGLAPFLYSGGGQVFDDEENPTSLAFSDGGSQDALTQTLTLLRDPHLTLTAHQLAKASPLQWFERGRLGMIAGYRSLVPRLRHVSGLDFDVMPMPVLGSSATVADVTGVCLSSHAASSPAAADLMVHLLSTDQVDEVARTGYVVPSNLGAAASDAFLQPGRMPDHARVFTTTVRYAHFPPVIQTMSTLEQAVAASLDELVTVPVLNLPQLTTQIDEESRAVLSPESPSASTG